MEQHTGEATRLACSRDEGGRLSWRFVNSVNQESTALTRTGHAGRWPSWRRTRAGRDAARRVGHDGLLFVELRHASCITGIGALDKQAREVFRFQGLLVVRHRGSFQESEA
jgi:hypothetical protein